VNTSGAAFDSFDVAAERQIGRYGDRPFVTWYGHGGGRVELSFKTFGNWVAKTANLLVDELGAEPGDRVGAVLIDHWQTPVVLAACWRAGVQVVAVPPGAEAPEGLVAAFVHEELLPPVRDALPGAGTVLVALSSDPLGRSRHDLGGALDYGRVVPGMADEFASTFAGDGDPAGAALTTSPGTAGAEAATMAELLDRAAALAAATGLSDADRLLSALPVPTVAGAAAGLLAPFTTGAGVVLDRDPARFWKRVADERVAVAVLDPDQAGRLLAAGPPPADLDRSRLRVVACHGAGEALRVGFPATFDIPLVDDWSLKRRSVGDDHLP
jgi:uncharacterized protein (TIGR03089 family)